jgi:RimJ/RimL family protein N-acetyltransferase
LKTERLHLIACDEALLRAIVSGPDETARCLNVVVPASWPEFPETFPYALEMFANGHDVRPWWTYVFVDPERSALVGSGGFKGPPSSAGIVELGYETAPSFRNRGYATEAARGLAAFAFGRPEIVAIDAHTVPERNASTRVLERIGMRFIAIVQHPGDGTIWHWRVTREGWEATR